jgi:hypothetical protein
LERSVVLSVLFFVVPVVLTHLRIAQLEMLDEIEELELVLEHYAVTWGVKLISSPDPFRVPWNDWGISPKKNKKPRNDD